MEPATPNSLVAHTAYTQERLAASSRPRRSPRGWYSPLALLRRLAAGAAHRWVTLPPRRAEGTRQRRRIAEA